MDKVVVRNLFSLFFLQGANYLIPLISLPYLVRILGPENYGVYGFSLAVVQYFVLVTQYGFDMSVTKKIAINDSNIYETSKIFWSVVIIKIVLVAFSSISLLFLVYFIDILQTYKYVIYSAFLMVLGQAFNPVWLFQGKQSMGWIVFVNISSKLMSLFFLFYYVRESNDIALAALINSFGYIASCLISFLVIFKFRWINIVVPKMSDLKREFQDGWHLFMSNIAGSFYINSIPVVLGFLVTPTLVGYYVAADKIRFAIQGLFKPVTQAFYPKISRLLEIDLKSGVILIRKLLKVQSAVVLFVVILVSFFSKNIIELLYGVEYENSISVFRILLPVVFLVGVSNVLGIQGMICIGMRKEFTKIVWLGATLNIIIMLPMIYLFSIVGAALSVLTTEMVILLLILKNTSYLFRQNLLCKLG